MAIHTMFAGVSGAAGAAGAGMLAAMHTDPIMIVFGGMTSLAAIGGFVVASLSFAKHQNDQSALERHEEHDDTRFDRIEAILLSNREVLKDSIVVVPDKPASRS
jgi:hypothetical protein